MSRSARRPARAPTRDYADRDGMTNEEIAKVLGTTRQAVSQTVQKALVKLRRELNRRGISAADLF